MILFYNAHNLCHNVFNRKVDILQKLLVFTILPSFYLKRGRSFLQRSLMIFFYKKSLFILFIGYVKYTLYLAYFNGVLWHMAVY